MIASIGVDIAEVKRVEEAAVRWGKRFLDKVYTPAEIAFCEGRPNKYQSYAARFAGKEAVSKCLGTGFRRGVYPNLIEIADNEKSRPSIKLHGKAAEFGRDFVFHLSLSHDKNMVVAVAVMEKMD